MNNILSELFRMFWKMLWGHLFNDLIKTRYDMIKRRIFGNGKRLFRGQQQYEF